MDSLNTSLLNSEVKTGGRVSRTSSTEKKREPLSSPLLGERKIAVASSNKSMEELTAIQLSKGAPSFVAHNRHDAFPSMIEAPLSTSITLEAKEARLKALKELDALEQANNLAMLTARSKVASIKGAYVPPTFIPLQIKH